MANHIASLLEEGRFILKQRVDNIKMSRRLAKDIQAELDNPLLDPEDRMQLIPLLEVIKNGKIKD